MLLTALALCTFLAQEPSKPAPATGVWRAWLDSPGGELPFELELRSTDGKWQAAFSNGPEIQGVPLTKLEGNVLTLRFGHYDATITANVTAEGKRLDGEWRKLRGPSEWTVLPFHATHGVAPRFADGPAGDPAAFAGRWSARFEADPAPAVALLDPREGGVIYGTFLTSTGDYRYLAGTHTDKRLRLSCFDGAHAFLFDAQLGEEGGLAGDFWSGDRVHDKWRARKQADAKLVDPQSVLRPKPGARFDQLSAIGMDGRLYSLAEPPFAGKLRIVSLFGSWCPNCHDEADFLVELDKKYRARGVMILGLAFEVTGDVERDLNQVRGFAARHSIEYPLLLAGKADKGAAARFFPLFDRIEAFPTTVFLDAEGLPRSAWSGYSGPATGAEHTELRERFEKLIETLLATNSPGAAETWGALQKVSWLHFGASGGLGLSFLADAKGNPLVHERVYGIVEDQPDVEDGDEFTLQQERVVPIAVSNLGLSYGARAFQFDRAAQVLVNPWDCGDRLAPNEMSCAPLLDPGQFRTATGFPKALRHDTTLVRREAAAALALDARAEIRALAPQLLPLLGDSAPEVRAQACWSVGELGLASARAPLLENLAHTSPAVRREALRALARLFPSDAEIAAAIAKLRDDVDPVVRKAAGGKSGALAERTEPAAIPFENR
ncbi:MAG: redoxin domain-containing protein [Planctomycetota bacterium]|nr:MAG: redoxin domain-containing protein [Planctomycetota bacterium]